MIYEASRVRKLEEVIGFANLWIIKGYLVLSTELIM